MKTRCLPHSPLFLAASAALCLSAASAGLAQPPPLPAAVPSESATAFAPDPPLVSLLLQRRQELRLSDKQVGELEAARAAFQKDAVKRTAEIRLREIELRELLEKKPFAPAPVEAKVRELDALRTELLLANLKAGTEIKARLSPAQQKQIEPFEAAAALSPTGGVAVAPDLRGQVQAVIKEQYQQQDVVELKVAQAVVTRILDWFKTLGLVVGIPLALVLTVLTFLGFSTVKDLREKVDNFKKGVDDKIKVATATVEAKLAEADGRVEQKLVEASEGLDRELNDARVKAAAIKAEAEALSAGYRELREQLDDLKRRADVKMLTAELAQLDSRIEGLEEIVFENTETAGPQEFQRLTASVRSMQKFFRNLGFDAAGGKNIKIQFDAERIFDPHYDSDDNTMYLAPIIAGDADIPLRLYAHYVLASLDRRLKMVQVPVRAIEYGLSLYYAASHSDKPAFAEGIVSRLRESYPSEMAQRPLVRSFNLKNELPLGDDDLSEFKDGYDENDAEMAVRLAGLTEAWGGLFWDVREVLGRAVADKVLFDAWRKLVALEGDGEPVGVFGGLVLEALGDAGAAAHSDRLCELFRRRGLNVEPAPPRQPTPPAALE